LAEEPAERSTWKIVPGAMVATGLVPLPTKRLKAVFRALPVPPLETGRVPVQPKVKLLLAIEPVMLVSLVTKPTRVVPKVLEPVPPLTTGNIPETSLVKETWPLFNSPPMDLTTPEPSEDNVVLPKALTLKRLKPEEEARVKIGLVVVAMF